MIQGGGRHGAASAKEKVRQSGIIHDAPDESVGERNEGADATPRPLGNPIRHFCFNSGSLPGVYGAPASSSAFSMAGTSLSLISLSLTSSFASIALASS